MASKKKDKSDKTDAEISMHNKEGEQAFDDREPVTPEHASDRKEDEAEPPAQRKVDDGARTHPNETAEPSERPTPEARR